MSYAEWYLRYGTNRDTFYNMYALADKKIESLQAKIDSLMLEFCPEQMTEEQIENWKKHQTVAKQQSVEE
jgi:hypothetical protein